VTQPAATWSPIPGYDYRPPITPVPTRPPARRRIDQSDLPVIERNFADGGDDITSGDAPEKGTHGQSGSRQHWGMTGLAAADVARCNT
jgi:hypothetical protein